MHRGSSNFADAVVSGLDAVALLEEVEVLDVDLLMGRPESMVVAEDVV